MKTRREIILDNVSDLVSRFVYYDRKEDEDLPRGAIQAAIAADEVSISDICDHFSDELEAALKKG